MQNVNKLQDRLEQRNIKFKSSLHKVNLLEYRILRSIEVRKDFYINKRKADRGVYYCHELEYCPNSTYTIFDTEFYVNNCLNRRPFPKVRPIPFSLSIYIEELLENSRNNANSNKNTTVKVINQFADLIKDHTLKSVQTIRSIDQSKLPLNWNMFNNFNIIAGIDLQWFNTNLREISSMSLREITLQYSIDHPSHPISHFTTNSILSNYLNVSFQTVKRKSEFLQSNEYKTYEAVFATRLFSMMYHSYEPVFIDETYFKKLHTKTKRWIKSTLKDKTFFSNVSQESFTVTLACCKDRILYWELNDDHNTGNHFISFLHRLNAQLANIAFGKYVLFLDNVRLHKTPKVLEMLYSRGIQTIYGVKYNCTYNLCEYAFSIVKRKYYKMLTETK